MAIIVRDRRKTMDSTGSPLDRDGDDTNYRSAPVADAHAQARAISEPILAALCAKGGHPVPSLEIVDALPGGDTSTARASSIRGAGTIELPHNLTKDLSHDGLESLLGHELGHMIRKRSPTMMFRHIFYWLFIPLAVAAPVIWAVGGITNTKSLYITGASALFLLALSSLGIAMALSRKHEADCDLFSHQLAGSFPGAVEHLGSYRAREKFAKRRTPWNALMAHHPKAQRRIDLIQKRA
ncbi:M48 family metalloprotease [Pseudarthrobacter sp. Y6]|uniref:M48 family metalloprotease n=1 Tax=Pseudarthrobacter sp. Y6 TaxID=3418422 RepID=UPI003CF201A1